MELIKVEQVMSVYIGKAGKCACGCAGKHFYASAFKDVGAKHRGYAVDAEDLSDTQVALAVAMINANPKAVDCDERDFRSVVLGKLMYVAYYAPAQMADFC